jgi:hypothetical protein
MLDAAKRFVPQLFMLSVAIGVSACSRTVNLELPSDMPVILTTEHENPGNHDCGTERSHVATKHT